MRLDVPGFLLEVRLGGSEPQALAERAIRALA